MAAEHWARAKCMHLRQWHYFGLSVLIMLVLKIIAVYPLCVGDVKLY